jgi:predicted Rossmann-fold nucleotide-binding protein
MKFKIGVYGSATDESSDLTNFAQIIGKEIAESGNIIITGACRGLPFDAVVSCKKNGGYSIGYSAVCQVSDHEKLMGTALENYDKLELIPQDYKHKNSIEVCRKYRTVSSVADCDAALFISGRWGTLNEFAIAYDMGKVIGVLTGAGKFASHAEDLIKLFNKKTTCKIFFDNDPQRLCSKLFAQIKDKSV